MLVCEDPHCLSLACPEEDGETTTAPWHNLGSRGVVDVTYIRKGFLSSFIGKVNANQR